MLLSPVLIVGFKKGDGGKDKGTRPWLQEGRKLVVVPFCSMALAMSLVVNTVPVCIHGLMLGGGADAG